MAQEALAQAAEAEKQRALDVAAAAQQEAGMQQLREVLSNS